MKPKQANPYEALGIEQDANPDDIKKAYRKGASACHPDTHPNDPLASEKFTALALAYEVLSDPKRKAEFDELGEWREAMDINKRVCTELSQLFVNVIKSYGDESFEMDIFDEMDTQLGAYLNTTRKEAAQKIRTEDNVIKRWERVLKSVKRKAGAVPVFQSVADMKIMDARRAITLAELKRDEEIEIYEACRKFLKDFDWEQEDNDVFIVGQLAGAASVYAHMKHMGRIG